ncbi:MAG: hypothetical protein C0173_00785 [Desulfurella sp.]|uniref:ParA family protein n=1 Tax=Desulfurella sp. TaxID=1962857 RepID=UPI000CA769B5|nr:ParA family protein [Desulfurella sp.]PMP93417.1 MAG: hypothetical protein C0173_00785 [Desulfurella sp.]
MVYSFINQKGGVGKSTLAFNFAIYCSLTKNTIAIDLDPQGTVTKLLTDTVDNSLSASRIFEGIDVDEVIVKTNIKQLSIIPGTLDLEEKMNTRNLSTLKAAISKLKRQFDIIIVDTRPSLNTVFETALQIANVPVIPLLPESSSIYDLPHMIDIIIKNSNLTYAKFVLNNVDTRIKTHNIISISLQKELTITPPIIHASADIKNSMSNGKSVFEFAPYSRAAREFVLLFKHLTEGEKSGH